MEKNNSKVLNVIPKPGLQLKRYPLYSNDDEGCAQGCRYEGSSGNASVFGSAVHTINCRKKKMDLYIYQLDEHTKLAYLSLAKCASNVIRRIFGIMTGKPKNLRINIQDKNDERLKDLIIFSFY